MKNKHFRESDISDKLQATLTTEYKKQNVTIALGSFSTPNFLAIGFEFKIGGELCKAIICNGKTRRSDRRKAIKSLMLAFEYDYLEQLEFINRKNLRGALIFSKSEVAND